jgi:hypothetical protein
MDFDGPENPKPALIERTIDNASAVLRALLPGGEIRQISSGVSDILIGAVALTAIQVFALTMTRPKFVLLWDIPYGIGIAALFLLALCIPALVLGKGKSIPLLATGILWAMSLGRLAALAVEIGFGLSFSLIGDFVTLVLSAFPAILFALAWLGPRIGGVSVAAGLAVLAIFNLEYLAPETGPEVSEVFPQVEPEDLFAAQNVLLNRQLKGIRPGDPDRPELFAILGAGHPYQDVFAREVEAVASILESDFDAEGRIVRLVNSARDPLKTPLLSRRNLNTVVAGLREQMQDDDILLLFVTSHGAPDRFDTEFSPFIQYSLSATDLAAVLENDGDQPTVAVISACYSGSFASALATANRLVITAADTDSVSFGCNDKNEWTEWGRAFWVGALSQSRDFREAARIAKGIVAKREAAQDLPPSDPMVLEGAAIGATLDRWLGTLN